MSFLGDIPNSSPTISGILFFSVLKFNLSISKLGTIFLIAFAIVTPPPSPSGLPAKINSLIVHFLLKDFF